jgi:hypothetical protein
MLIVFFAGVAAVEWWDARAERRSSGQRADAQVIRHPSRDGRVSPAA